MQLSRLRATEIGAAAILLAVGVQLFNDVACYKMDFAESVSHLWFPLIPLIPAALALATANPLRAIGACACVVPWYMLAYYTDCIRPYSGGGASMIYVAVVLWGFPSAVLGALITGPVCRRIGVTINAR